MLDHIASSMRPAAAAAGAEPPGPIAQTSYGPLLGRRHPASTPPPPSEPFSAPGTVAYFGVPYCEQPVPPRRFRPAQPLVETWKLPRPCLERPPIAPQPLAPQLADSV